MQIAIFVLAAALGAGLCLHRRTWKVTTHFITLVHELGHAFTGLIFGSKFITIKISLDGSGVTTSQSSLKSNYLLGRILTLLAGYTAPVIVGSALLWLSYIFEPEKIWLGLSVISVLCILFMRNIFAFIISLVFTSFCVSMLYYANELFSYSALIGLSSLFIIGGYKDIRNVMQLHRVGKDENSDPRQLFTLTGLPVVCWEVIMAIVTLIIPLVAIWYYFIH